MIFIFLLPVLIISSAVFMYEYTGRKELLKLDLVQFVYAFILTPMVFIWLKSFLFYFLVNELNAGLTVQQIFVVDTIYSVIFLFVFAFIVMHSLTKSFEIKRSRDPQYDIFAHSEFFHLVSSHSVIYVGAMVLFSFLSIVNLYIPLVSNLSIVGLYFMAGFGFVFGIASFISLLLTEINNLKFVKTIKSLFAFFFLFHIMLYALFSPGFDGGRVMFWFVCMIFSGFVFSSLLIERSEKAMKFLRKLHYKY